MSKILNPSKRPQCPPNASILDPQQVQHSRRDRKRLRTGQYPELDKALYEWQQAMQHRKISITILAQASSLYSYPNAKVFRRMVNQWEESVWN